jgi:bacillithiol synthase
MNCTASRIPYRQTNAFSKIALDYIDNATALQPFFSSTPTLQGIANAIEARKNFATNRKLLVEELHQQYNGLPISSLTQQHIALLENDNTFTITTAHQNNIFTGPLYFIYKILHAIKLAQHLKTNFPAYNFVPVYYIGSEDADLAELNHIRLSGKKILWHTKQTGSVGRMKVDKDLTQLIAQMEGQLLVEPHGQAIINLFKKHYQEGVSIATATFTFVNELFAEYGLVVLQPDNAILKKQMLAVFEDDLLNQTAASIVNTSATALTAAGYKVQANPRSINLFYLIHDKRERIEQNGDKWNVINTAISFTQEQLIAELNSYPERFSPNVILRGLYQETILPNIAFIGGGGETAYWLQLKELFNYYKVPFPVLVLRNSFLILEEKWQQKIGKLELNIENFFASAEALFNQLVVTNSTHQLELNGTLQQVEALYQQVKEKAGAIDTTLTTHVEALQKKTLQRLNELEKKMLRAEKRKFVDQRQQINTIKDALFPANGLQERVENIAGLYARYGRQLIDMLYQHSLALEQEFVLLSVSN